jgi:hypothetical protein
MESIRAKDAILQQALRKSAIPEKSATRPLAYFEVSRYVAGQFTGMFQVAQLITEDAQGKPLKKPLKKIVADGVDMVVAMSSLETALRRRVFK